MGVIQKKLGIKNKNHSGSNNEEIKMRDADQKRSKNVLDSLSEYELKLKESQTNLALIQKENYLIGDAKTEDNPDEVQYMLP